ncbi:hypothetical protein CBL_09237 [Carabus blaptoides fortunei]
MVLKQMPSDDHEQMLIVHVTSRPDRAWPAAVTVTDCICEREGIGYVLISGWHDNAFERKRKLSLILEHSLHKGRCDRRMNACTLCLSSDLISTRISIAGEPNQSEGLTDAIMIAEVVAAGSVISGPLLPFDPAAEQYTRGISLLSLAEYGVEQLDIAYTKILLYGHSVCRGAWTIRRMAKGKKIRTEHREESGDSRTILDCHHVAITETNIMQNVPYPEYGMNSHPQTNHA